MAKLGWAILALGFLFQVLIPLGWPIGRPTGRFLGIPAEMAALFIATWVLVLGLIIVYFTWLRPYAERLDRSVQEQR